MNHEMENASDLNDLIALANSDSGQQLFNMLKQNNDAELERIMQLVQEGNLSEAGKSIQQILSDPRASALIEQLRGSL